MMLVGHVLYHVPDHVLDHVPDHVLDHMPDHILDHMIIGLVATALQKTIKRCFYWCIGKGNNWRSL